jgi:hypothetical protein
MEGRGIRVPEWEFVGFDRGDEAEGCARGD